MPILCEKKHVPCKASCANAPPSRSTSVFVIPVTVLRFVSARTSAIWLHSGSGEVYTAAKGGVSKARPTACATGSTAGSAAS